MSKKKLLILIPDGVGLRNFAFSNFKENANKADLEVLFWNNTNFDLTTLGLNEIKTPKPKHHFLTDILKRVKIDIYIDWYTVTFGELAFQDYKFKLPQPKTFNDWVKTILFKGFKKYFGLNKKEKIQPVMSLLEERTTYFQECIRQLEKINPDFVFCSNQRPITAIAPIQAAKFLNIPTGTFIFSWDNLPKATMVIEPNYFFVWSEFMKKELVKYNPHIQESNIFITGTPQFEIYTNQGLLAQKESFAKKFSLSTDVKYICFSGDDHTTSPFDEYYLRDLAQAVQQINQESNWGRIEILFRRCPVDKSARYNEVLGQFSDLITSVDPDWQQLGQQWNQIMPMPSDQALLVNTVQHSLMVFNVGSSMVFDFYALGKPCCYFNYDPIGGNPEQWTIKRLNNFIHFRSMPDKSAVLWVDQKEDIKMRILNYLDQPLSWDNKSTGLWFETIINQPISDASKNICSSISSLC